jgi:hypothetical protein
MRINLLPHKADFGDSSRSPRSCWCGVRAYCFDDEKIHTRAQNVRRGAAIVGYALAVALLVWFI